MQVKGNQPRLLHDITVLTAQTQPQSSHHEDQLGQRNRIEARCTSVWPVATGQLGADWAAVACLIQVCRHTEVFNTRLGTWQPRSQTAYCVCTRHLSALQAHRAVRDHWLIENALHHVRDVAMAEDACRIRHRPEVFAQLRTWALNLLRQTGHDNISAARQTIGWSHQALLHLCQVLQR